MRRLKFLLVFVFLLVGTLIVFAFTNDKYRQSTLALQCLKYNATNNPVYPPDLVNPWNWTSTFGSPSPSCIGGTLLCGICFDTINTTAAQATQLLYEYHRATGSFPLHGQTIFGLNGQSVTVYKTEVE
jgi:hypothetical protein